MAKHQEERVERALKTMVDAGLTEDQIREIVAAIADLTSQIAKDYVHERR